MADDAEVIDGLKQTLTRGLLIGLALWYFALAGLQSAFENVNGEEVNKLLVGQTQDSLTLGSVSWVFGERISKLTYAESVPGTPNVRGDLENLAKKWFRKEYDVLGTTIPFDLRVIPPLLPFVLPAGVAYLILIHRKLRIVCDAVVQKSNGQSISSTRHFLLHPQWMTTAGLSVAAGALGIYTYAVMQPYAALVPTETTVSYVTSAACFCVYLAFYVNWITKILNPAAQQRAWASTLGRGLARTFKRFLFTGRDFARGFQRASGALLVLLTLSMPLALEGCTPLSEGKTESGFTYLTGNLLDVGWFNYSDSAPFTITDLGLKPLFAGVLAVSVPPLIAIVIPRRVRAWIPARVVEWYRKILVWSSAALLLFVTCTVCFYDPGRFWPSDVVSTVVWIGSGIFVWRSGRGDLNASDRLAIVSLILLPAFVGFGLRTSLELDRHGLVGIPVLMLGTFMLLRSSYSPSAHAQSSA